MAQISARISAATSSALDRYVDARGLKKKHVIEQALQHHLRALRDLAVDAMVLPQIVVGAETAAHLARRTKKPRKPTPAMRALFEK